MSVTTHGRSGHWLSAVPRGDLGPVGRCVGVQRGDRGLQDVGAAATEG
jgi:hypothetical protein